MPVNLGSKKYIRKDVHFGDRFFRRILKILSIGLLGLLFSISLFLLAGAWPAIKEFGPSFLVSTTWDPVKENFGALPVIFGTLLSSLIALILAGPISVGIALFLNELAPKKIADTVSFFIEMLASIPSVVYGLWGIFVLAPWLRTTVEPFLGSTLGFIPLFQGPPYGVGILAAGIVLAIMITPTVSAISREVFRAVPQNYREAALALGGTRSETMFLAVLKTAKNGVFGALTLGLGRALGETMAVTMVIGNRNEIAASLFAPGQTMASIIANEYSEASTDLHLASLTAIGFCLLIVTLIVNGTARFIVWSNEKRWK